MAALYAEAFTVKSGPTQSEHPLDLAVMPLGGLWWAHYHADFADGIGVSRPWTTMILRPQEVIGEVVAAASTTGSTSVPRNARLPGSYAPSCARR